MSSLSSAVRELYACAPADFVARRKALLAQARAEGDREVATQIAALRKPTVAAAIVNQLDDAAMAAVLALGQELRAAQTRLDSDAMKETTARRQRLLHDIVSQLALTGQAAEEVRSTLLAATADRAAADAVASRALVRPLSYSGWGDVDLGDAVAHQAAMDPVGDDDGSASGVGMPSGEHTRGAASSDAASSATRQRAAGSASAVGSGNRQLRPALRLVTEPTAEEIDAARNAAEASISAEITRLETRLRAAQAAVDSATAARDAAASALKDARERLAELS